jgi:hypothetical protein
VGDIVDTSGRQKGERKFCAIIQARECEVPKGTVTEDREDAGSHTLLEIELIGFEN